MSSIPDPAVAGVSLAAGFALGGIVVRGVIKAARWVAGKTKTKKDDRAIEKVDRFVSDHPELVGELIDWIERRVKEL